ncbi:MAG: patatin-like phospholipase family protein [Pseudomonadota bacterium]|nr:patatin-like phospholipase family protein [Pseudomonadota bacterium]
MNAPKRINLALQGGGSHGAYTWGALDAILADERLEIAAVSGASAGAMNAVVMASGLDSSGAEGAREKLERFWRAIARDAAPITDLPLVDAWTAMWKTALAPASQMAIAADASSPYLFNPLNINPVSETLANIVDFASLRRGGEPKLFVAATNARTGKGAMFRREILTAAHVMASATLPHLFQAAIIDGEPYWDGGYSGNPPLWPLFQETDCRDTIIVQINPIERPDIPRTAEAISNRVNEITFNASLLAEFHVAEYTRSLVEQGLLPAERFPAQRLHRIGGDGKLESYPSDTKFDVSWAFLQELRDLGRASAKRWLSAHFADIGESQTLDVRHALRRTAAG